MLRKLTPSDEALLRYAMNDAGHHENTIKAFVEKISDINYVVFANDANDFCRFRIWRGEPVANVTHNFMSSESLSSAMDIMWDDGIRYFYLMADTSDEPIPNYKRYTEQKLSEPCTLFYHLLIGNRVYPPTTTEIHGLTK